jgi:hypothetical protein
MRENSQSMFLVEELQPSWLETRAKRIAYGTVVALILGLIFGPILELSEWAIFVLSSEMPRLNAALIFGLIILVGVGLGCWSKSPLKNGL